MGLTNIFAEVADDWPAVSWEAVVDRNPDILVLGDLARTRFPGDRLDDKKDFLASDPVAGAMAAVQGKRYIALHGAELNPSIRAVDGIEARRRPRPAATAVTALDRGGRVATRNRATGPALILIGLTLLVLSVMVAVTLGTADISLVNVRDILTNHLRLTDIPVRRTEDAIVWEDRLPRSWSPRHAVPGWRCAVWCCNRCCATRWPTRFCWASPPALPPAR